MHIPEDDIIFNGGYLMQSTSTKMSGMKRQDNMHIPMRDYARKVQV
jgi:hypothetical protein